MTLRRELMNYVGTGAIGGIVGYYAGAKGLLGLQSDKVVRPATEDDSTEEDTTENSEQTGLDVYDDFENGNLNDPSWRAIGHGPAGLREPNEIGIANEGHDSQHSLYLDQGGSYSNFGAETTINPAISPEKISFRFEPTSSDQYTKNRFTFSNGDTVGIQFNNHIEDDIVYLYDQNGETQVRDTAVNPDIGQFVQVRLENIDWSAANIGEVHLDGDLIAEDMPFVNEISEFDNLVISAIGGGGTKFRVDDIAWGN